MEFLGRALDVARSRERAALITVIRVSGSAPRHVGAQLIVCDNGSLYGTIGGGRVEWEAVRAGREVAAGQPARRVVHHLVRDLAMCCGGSVELYIEPLAPTAPALEAALACIEAREPAELITSLAPRAAGAKFVERRAPRSGAPGIFPAGSLAGAADDADASAAEPAGEWFVEPIWPRERLIVFGCGHVSRAIGPLAAGVGFEVVVCDDDETGALAEHPAWAARVIESFDRRDVERALGPLGPADYALIVTRDHAVDQAILEQLLPEGSLAYLGLIGSRGKIGRFRKRLEAKGIATPERWARLSAPIGLDIGAETPAEIAVSVVAELIARRHARLAPDRDEPGSGDGGGSAGGERDRGDGERP